jgi:MFS family permease
MLAITQVNANDPLAHQKSSGRAVIGRPPDGVSAPRAEAYDRARMSASSQAAAVPADALGAGGLFVLTLGTLDFGLEQSIIIPALPRLAVHYHASTIAIAWLATAFLLSATVAAPLVGRLGDLYGKRRLLLAALGAFTLGSLLCALGQSVSLAIAGRAVQGVGAAVAPLTLGLTRDFVAPGRRTRAVGVLVGAGNVGAAVGFVVGGLLVDWFSPAAVFWFLFLFGALLMAGVFFFVGESPVRTPVQLDVVGALLLGAGLVALLLAISKGEAWGWSSGAIVGLFVASAVAFTAFALVERRVRRPLLDLALVARRPFANANVCALTYGFAFFTAVYLIPQIAGAPEATGYGLGLPATQIGLLLLPTGAAGLTAGWLAGRTLERIGRSAIVAAAAVLGAVAYALLAVSHDTVAALVVGSAAVGAGWGAIPASFYSLVLGHAAADKSAVSVSVPLVFRNIGASLGVTVAFVVLSSAGSTGLFPANDGFVRAFVVSAAACMVVAAAGLSLAGRRR